MKPLFAFTANYIVYVVIQLDYIILENIWKSFFNPCVLPAFQNKYDSSAPAFIIRN
nr:MAG TPA: hypothetical protein [Caudoviricetes sp.]